MKREPISKKLRFEIFKRDNFTCVYCGRKPPTVVLEIDHVIPVSKDGTNDDINLVTSCFDCNNGKRANLLSEVPVPLGEVLETEREKLEQLKAITELVHEREAVAESLWEGAATAWAKYDSPHNPKLAKLPSVVVSAIKRYLGLLPVGEVIDAINITNNRLARKSYMDRCRYFCGVCNHKVRGELPTRPSYGYRPFSYDKK
jgi:hypothetical protein